MKKYTKENGRKNMRLRGYDYSLSGLYFLTPVIQHRLHLFGKVENRKMILNDAGRMIEKWYWELENKYPDKKCHEMVVMPNHFHCIIENLDTSNAVVRATLCGRPEHPEMDAHNGTLLRGHPETKTTYGLDNKKYNATIGDAMDWFKTMTTNEYIRGVKNFNWKRFDGKLWQRNYYDHIIRNQQSYIRISKYIINNPAKWDDDKFSD